MASESPNIDNQPVVKRRRTLETIALGRDDWELVLTILAIKAVLFLFVGQGYQVLEDKRIAGLHGWLEIWNRWDAVNYIKLAQYGYSTADQRKPLMVFYPLFPWTLRFCSIITGDYLVSAIIISTLASLAVGIFLRRLVQLDYSRQVARRAVWFLFIFPTSYFLHVGYTESLFLMLVLGCVLAARRQRWLLAGVLGGLSCLTRGSGLVLLPALVVEAAQQYSTARRFQWRWLWIGVVGLGFGGYLLLNKLVAGDAFAFLQIRFEFYRISLAWPWTAVREAIGSMNRTPSQAEIIGMQEFLFIVLGFACTLLSWVKLRPIYSVWMTGNWLLVTSVSFVSSMPRYTLTMFPIYFLFALLAARRVWFAVITVWSILYLGLFASLFAWGRWAF